MHGLSQAGKGIYDWRNSRRHIGCTMMMRGGMKGRIARLVRLIVATECRLLGMLIHMLKSVRPGCATYIGDRWRTCANKQHHREDQCTDRSAEHGVAS